MSDVSATIDDAIRVYHDLLTPDVADASWEALDAELASRRLNFGGRVICSVLRPYFLTPDDERIIRRAARDVYSGLFKTFAIIAERDYEPVLGLSPAEARLAAVDCGFEPAVTIGRLDGFLMRDGRFGFVEFNAESPGGIAFGATLAEIFQTLPVMRRFAERYALRSYPVLDGSLDALLGAYRAWGGTMERPAIAIVDWLTSPTYIEFEICRDAFRARGYPTEIVDPTALEYRDGRLRAGQLEIDLVYRRLVASEIPDKLDLDHPIVAAARDGAACVASGFRAWAIHSKAMFALLSDPATSAPLTPEERASVDAFLPWTRLVRETTTVDWDGKRVDLLELATRAREELVVKPATDYGGAGVVLGWTVDGEAWERALRDALTRPSVLQRRVSLPSEPFPVRTDGRTELVEYLADIDPYCFHGRTDIGAGTRLSRSQLLNVTAGAGSAAPVFVVEPRG